MHAEEFRKSWGQEKSISFERPLAFTLDPRVVPLHFAWKQRAILAKHYQGCDIISVILEVHIPADENCPLL